MPKCVLVFVLFKLTSRGDRPLAPPQDGFKKIKNSQDSNSPHLKTDFVKSSPMMSNQGLPSYHNSPLIPRFESALNTNMSQDNHRQEKDGQRMVIIN